MKVIKVDTWYHVFSHVHITTIFLYIAMRCDIFITYIAYISCIFISYISDIYLV